MKKASFQIRMLENPVKGFDKHVRIDPPNPFCSNMPIPSSVASIH